jgi:hypothetical protein
VQEDYAAFMIELEAVAGSAMNMNGDESNAAGGGRGPTPVNGMAAYKRGPKDVQSSASGRRSLAVWIAAIFGMGSIMLAVTASACRSNYC